MIEVTTESGAVYHLDTDKKVFKRLPGPEVLDRTWNDDVWTSFESVSAPVVGSPLLFSNGTKLRRTTPVVSVKEI